MTNQFKQQMIPIETFAMIGVEKDLLIYNLRQENLSLQNRLADLENTAKPKSDKPPVMAEKKEPDK